MNFDIDKYTIYKTIHGSQAYGLSTPESDLDIRGICIPPLNYFHGFAFHFEQYTNVSNDICIYDIRKFFSLAAQCNPNIIELLWVPEKHTQIMTKEGEELLSHRSDFLTTRVKHTFSGYAMSQLKRIKTHRKWLLKPVTEQPTRAQFGLPESTVLSSEIRGVIRSMEEAGHDLERGLSAELLTAWKREREREFYSAQKNWEQYQTWKKNRNPKRAELEARFHYDSKHACHLVRLLKMCREILTIGQVIIERPDREELLAIKNGAWSYDQLIEWAEIQEQELNILYKTCTILPPRPDLEKLDKLCMKIVEMALSKSMC